MTGFNKSQPIYICESVWNIEKRAEAFRRAAVILKLMRQPKICRSTKSGTSSDALDHGHISALSVSQVIAKQTVEDIIRK